MRISFQTLAGTWLLSLAVAFGLQYARRSLEVDSVATNHARRGIASVSTPRSNANSIAMSKAVCHQPESYACEWRVYGPQASDSSSTVRECVKDAANENQICLQVLKISFQSTGAATADGVLSETNEVRCSLHGLGWKSSIESDGEDITTAVLRLMAKCEDLASGIE